MAENSGTNHIAEIVNKATDIEDRELDHHKAYNYSRDGDPGSSSNELWKEDINARPDMDTIESLFFTEDWVFIVVDLIASKISSQIMGVVKKTIQDGAESIEYADGHPLNALISAPNPLQDYHSFMYNNVVNYILLGNAMVWYSKANQWLVSLRASTADIRFDRDGSIAAYQFPGADTELQERNTKIRVLEYAVESIIHIRRPNPASLIYGLSPFWPGSKSILFNRYSSDYLNAFYLRQATPSIIFEMDKAINEDQALRFIRSFELAQTGRNNARRAHLLPKGVHATTMTHSIADQRLTDLINANRETILSLLKVPKHEVGLQTAGSLGSEEYKTALKNFWESTLIPTCRMIEGAFNKFFAKALGPDYSFKFDLSNVSALQDDMLAKALLGKEMLNAGMSINEVRSRVWDLSPSPIPANDLPFISMPRAPTFGAPGFADPVPAAIEAPAKVESAPAVEAITEDKSMALLSLIQSRNEGWMDRYVKNIGEVVQEKEGQKIFDAAVDMLVAMAELAAPILKENLREVKAVKPRSEKELRAALIAAFQQLKDKWKSTYVNELEAASELGYDSQIEFVLNKDDRDKINTLRARDAAGRRQILTDRALDSFFNVSESRTEAIMKTITEGSAAKESITEIIGRVAKELGNIDNVRRRADTIARTETLTAVSIGQGAALRNAQKVIKGLRKAWLNAGDNRVRDSHIELQGEIVDAREDFSNGLRWPRDIGGPPEETINCRCTIVMLTPGEDLPVN